MKRVHGFPRMSITKNALNELDLKAERLIKNNPQLGLSIQKVIMESKYKIAMLTYTPDTRLN